MADDVQPIHLTTCLRALAGTVTGMERPRRPTPEELAGIIDAGLPRTSATVQLRVLPHTTRQVPALLVEGTRRPSRLPLAYASFLVEHPKTRLLIDPGICRHARDRALASLPTPLRLATRPGADPLSTVAGLEAIGLQPEDVDSALATHLHWDHVSGLLDLGAMPLQVHSTEWNWATRPGPAPAGGVRPAVLHRPRLPFDLDGPPVLTFPHSHDLMGDGSVVLVALPGHTPGSIGVLLNTTGGWTLLIGDTAWLGRQVVDCRQKAAFPGLLVDDDRETTWRSLLRVRAVHEQVRVVPAHDPSCLT